MENDLVFSGTAMCLGDDIDTDTILPARYLNLTDEEELKLHCMEGMASDFYRRVSKGAILIAGNNFGCGSSREHAPIAIKGCGFSCVVAKSFSRIFYRNAIGIGLPALTVSDTSGIAEGNDLTVDCANGVIRNLTMGNTYHGDSIPPFMIEILRSNGLINYVFSRLKADGRL